MVIPTVLRRIGWWLRQRRLWTCRARGVIARDSGQELAKDLDVAIKFANGLADAGEVTKAEKILASLQEDFPGDNDLAHALKNISARKTMDKGVTMRWPTAKAPIAIF